MKYAFMIKRIDAALIKATFLERIYIFNFDSNHANKVI